MRTAVILTAIPVETEHVLGHLRDVKEEEVRGTLFLVGRFGGWRVATAELGAGNGGAAAIGERALSHFSPEVALFVGVAGGIKDVAIGDVVAATKVYGYESGKVEDGGFKSRPDVMRSAHRLEQRARAVLRDGQWTARRRDVSRGCKAIVAPIAAGEKVVASTKNDLYALLRATYNDAAAIEMEARGFLEAVHISGFVDGMVVRGISDLLADKSAADEGGSQARAADSAAAFAFELLARLDTVTTPPEEEPAFLVLPQRQWRADVSPPGALLRPEFGIVPFHGREEETQDLEDWCADAAETAIRLYTGAGGMGKTRLFIEMCLRRRAAGWRAGFIERTTAPGAADGWRSLLTGGKAALVVVDYAETQGEMLRALLVAAAARPDGGQRLRVVLLARAAGDWWDLLKGQPDAVGGLLGGPATRWHQLRPLALSLEERRRSCAWAHERFARILGRPAMPVADVDFADRVYDRVLMLHIHALATVEGVLVKGEDGLLDYLLRREQRFWLGLAESMRLGPPLADGIAQAMALVTLNGGAATQGQAQDFLSKTPLLDDQPKATLNAVAKVLHEAYPGVDWIEPLRPDLLGEHLVERELSNPAYSERLNELMFGARDD